MLAIRFNGTHLLARQARFSQKPAQTSQRVFDHTIGTRTFERFVIDKEPGTPASRHAAASAIARNVLCTLISPSRVFG